MAPVTPLEFAGMDRDARCEAALIHIAEQMSCIASALNDLLLMQIRRGTVIHIDKLDPM